MFHFGKLFSVSALLVPSIAFSAQIHQVNNKDALMIRNQAVAEKNIVLANNNKTKKINFF